MSTDQFLSNRDLLKRVGMLDAAGQIHRSKPLQDPRAFHQLAGRLFELVTEPFDLVVVRDLAGDRLLGYSVGLLAGCPVSVSYDWEGLIESEAAGGQDVHEALLVADTHFTNESLQAAAVGLRQRGVRVVGAAVLVEQLSPAYDFNVWSLEQSSGLTA